MYISRSTAADVRSYQPFRVLVANIRNRTIDLLQYQVAATVSAHPEALVESQLLHAEVFGSIIYDREAKFRKQHASVHDI